MGNYTLVKLPLGKLSSQNLFTSGWGATSFGGFSSNKLLEVPVVVVNLDTCRSPGGVYQDVSIILGNCHLRRGPWENVFWNIPNTYLTKVGEPYHLADFLPTNY